MFREIPPTAGLPFNIKSLLTSFHSRNTGSLEDDFKRLLGVGYARITYSGTAALYIILETLKKLSPKKTVIIPSFICPLVPLAIERAGLKILVCDIAKSRFDFEINQLQSVCLKNKDILAIIPVHLGGIPVNLEPVLNIAKNNGIFIVEDCAQSLGAMNQGRKTGTIGDFAFYSLCRGKGITIYEGGVIITKADFSGLIEETAKDIEKENRFSECLKLIELFGYWIFYRPQLFWFAFRLPQIFWKIQDKPERAFIEYFDSNFPLHNVSEVRKTIGHLQWQCLEKEIDSQREKTQYYIENLKEIKNIRIITEAPGDYSNYPYLTLIFEEKDKQEKAFRILNTSGRGISRIYLKAITDYRYLKNLYSPLASLNARDIASKHITLSTSTFLEKSDQNYIIEKLRELK
ncbi:MAG: DegT/DnrJ/EryC1/StrS aminotransferase family protein [Candidatus Omnitrophica bacterium]|nr:DegT/DnrJ/EryC1/StrS aminotransferase family protein [Candidatus Omnitrophota bacterium]